MCPYVRPIVRPVVVVRPLCIRPRPPRRRRRFPDPPSRRPSNYYLHDQQAGGDNKSDNKSEGGDDKKKEESKFEELADTWVIVASAISRQSWYRGVGILEFSGWLNMGLGSWDSEG